MRALVLKDLYVLIKQLKIYLVMIIVFSCLPDFGFSTVAIICAGLLPITALAYDEQSKWNTYADMMPYSSRDIVLSKYVLSYLAILISSVLTIVISLLLNKSIGVDEMMSLLSIIVIVLIMQMIVFPLMFKVGVEKGRIIFMLLAGGMACGLMFFMDPSLDTTVLKIFFQPLAIVISVITILLLNFLSILLSIKFYEQRKK